MKLKKIASVLLRTFHGSDAKYRMVFEVSYRVHTCVLTELSQLFQKRAWTLQSVQAHFKLAGRAKLKLLLRLIPRLLVTRSEASKGAFFSLF